MTPSVTPAQIRRLSRLMNWTCIVLIATLPLVVIVYWLQWDAGFISGHLGVTLFGPPAAWQRAACAAVTFVPLCLALSGLWHARTCFKCFENGNYFSLEVVSGLQRFAARIFASAIASIVATPAIAVLLTIHNPVGHRQVTLAFTSEQVATMFIAGLVWLIAAVMAQAQALAEENAQFV